ncbi:hypothetical protein LXA47_30555 [Massilia sp. P8910]|nr:hypothetical protein [Massilia antarctica]MCE3607912.1 hypothetical protein [Massilia antarctica]
MPSAQFGWPADRAEVIVFIEDPDGYRIALVEPDAAIEMMAANDLPPDA